MRYDEEVNETFYNALAKSENNADIFSF